MLDHIPFLNEMNGVRKQPEIEENVFFVFLERHVNILSRVLMVEVGMDIQGMQGLCQSCAEPGKSLVQTGNW
jgi:hypothetical protein